MKNEHFGPGLQSPQRGVLTALWALMQSVGALILSLLKGSLLKGMSLHGLLHTRVTTTRTTSGCLVLRVYGAALFTNWPSLRRRLAASPAGVTGVIVDLSDTTRVDQTVRAQLMQTQKDWARQQRALEIIGLTP